MHVFIRLVSLEFYLQPSVFVNQLFMFKTQFPVLVAQIPVFFSQFPAFLAQVVVIILLKFRICEMILKFFRAFTYVMVSCMFRRFIKFFHGAFASNKPSRIEPKIGTDL